MAVSLLKLDLFENGVRSLAVLARHNTARMDSVYGQLPAQFQGLRMRDDLERVRIFLDFRAAKDQPREGLRFHIIPVVDFVKANKGHLHASPGTDPKDWETWLYKYSICKS
jgi:hypothetical protein